MIDEWRTIQEIKSGANVEANLLALHESFAARVAGAANTCPDWQEAADIKRDSLRWVYDAAQSYDPTRSKESNFGAYVYQTVRWHVLHHIQSQHERKVGADGKVKKRLRQFVEIQPWDLVTEESAELDQDAAQRAVARLAHDDRKFIEALLRHKRQDVAAGAMGVENYTFSRRLCEIRPLVRRYYIEELEREADSVAKHNLMTSVKEDLAPKIEKGFPIPPKGNPPIKYPFGDMEPGDSMFIPKDADQARNLIKYYRRNRGGEGRTFTLRKAEQNGVHGVRVWRVS